MAATIQNVEADRGGQIVVSVIVANADGTLADLTGYTGAMQVRASPDDDEVLATGTVVIDDDLSKVTGSVASAATVDAAWFSAYYDVRITSGGEHEYVLAGRIKLRNTVTR